MTLDDAVTDPAAADRAAPHPAGAPAAPDAARPWLAGYPPGVPASVDGAIDRAGTLVELYDDALRRHAARTACICMGARLTYRDVDAAADALAGWLGTLGLAPGARVAVMMPNLPQYLVAIPAILRAGLVVVNVNPLYTSRELAHQLVDSGAEALIVLENFATTLEDIVDEVPVRHVLLTSVGDMLGPLRGRWWTFAARHLAKKVPEFALPLDAGRSVTRWAGALARGERAGRPRGAGVAPHSPAFLQYTGGTTGVSKGATLTHRNVVANVVQTEAWFGPMLERVGSDRALTVVCALPLYHIFALTLCAVFGARLGMTNLLIPNPRDLPGFVRTLREHRVNMFPAVNTLFNALLDEPGFASLDFSGLVVSNGGGMAVQRATAERWLAVTGCPVAEGYGLSETSPVATSNRVDLKAFTGTIGLPIPSTDIAIRDDDGRDVPAGEPGEICIRGPQVMAGYWQRPDETAKVMTADGFFRSGDVGVMDAGGQVRIVDRKKDMILVSGFNVYPTEIEQVVSQHPGVAECAAYGVPDGRSGEAVRLAVVRRDPTLDEAELARWCADNLTAYKRPRRIEFRDELPKSNVGKILRRELRETSVS